LWLLGTAEIRGPIRADPHESHAGLHPTRRSIVAAINDGAVNGDGPALVTLEDSPSDHDGYPGEQIGNVEDGELVLTGPVYLAPSSGKIVTRQAVETIPPKL
jgi:hypothetical protein